MAKIDPKLFDSRVVERNLKSGVIKQSEVDAVMKALPDDESNAEWTRIELEEAEIGEETLDEAIEPAGEPQASPDPEDL